MVIRVECYIPSLFAERQTPSGVIKLILSLSLSPVMKACERGIADKAYTTLIYTCSEQTRMREEKRTSYHCINQPTNHIIDTSNSCFSII